MIRDITIGQYYANTSVVHNMDPRTKLMGVLVYVLTLFLVKTPFCTWYILELFSYYITFQRFRFHLC